jgi:4-oxalocrotonate tautomerase
MPIVHVNLWKGIENEKVKIIIRRITDIFVDLGIPEHAVEVLIHEVSKSHWGVGGIPASEKLKKW